MDITPRERLANIMRVLPEDELEGLIKVMEDYWYKIHLYEPIVYEPDVITDKTGR